MHLEWAIPAQEACHLNKPKTRRSGALSILPGVPASADSSL
jgi:hypothetical protein